MLLLDASIWVAAGVSGHRWSSEAADLIRRPPGLLAALDLTLYEVVNVLGVVSRDPASARTVLGIVRRRCGDRLVTVDAELLEAALGLAAEHGLSAYGAAYVAAARRHGWKLVSIDVRDLVSKGLAVTPDAALYP